MALDPGKPALVPLWIAGMPDVLRRQVGRASAEFRELKLKQNDLARNTGCMMHLRGSQIDDTGSHYDGSAVHCVAVIEAALIHNEFQVLDSVQEMQREFYSIMSGQCNVEKPYFCRIKQVVKLPRL